MVKSNKLRKFLYYVFVIAIIGTIAYGAMLVYQNANVSVSSFTSDGYAIYASANSIKSSVYPFRNGDVYAYKKRNNKISFESDNQDIYVDDDTVMHYQNGNLVILKNVVGIDLEEIDKELILYYNLFKNTEIKSDSAGGFYVEGIDKKIDFKKLLMRITDNKYLIAGKDIRVVMFGEQIVEFGDYLYFEFINGSVVKLYNNEKFYQTVSSEIKISMGDIVIDLKDKSISKDKKPKITLSNLVIDMDGNIDVITEEAKVDKAKIEKPRIDKDIINPPADDGETGYNGGTSESEGNGSTAEQGNVQEEVESDQVYYKEPEFNVTSMTVTALKIDANIEITDDDGLLLEPVVFSIVENANANTVYEDELRDGNLSATISYPNLKPDTEYTLYAKASFKINELTFDKTFVSKIFRTEALGVSFRKSYVTKESIVVDLYKETYSKVSSVTMGIYNDEGNLIDYKMVDLTDKNKTEYQVTFTELEHNKTYVVKMYDIFSSGVVVDDGFSQVQTIKTLKNAPRIGDLTYRVNKVDSTFELDVTRVVDDDYGIYNYRYEVFDARQNLNTDVPVLTLEQSRLGTVNVQVDDSKVYRGMAYTYRLVVEFNDNEKKIEYSKNLGSVMQLDGVEFPKVRWEETMVTWEMIRGTIVIDDPSGAVQSNVYKVVYKNSIDLYTVDTITTETPHNEIPIDVNYLRANETYTFDVYASINLQNGQASPTQTYIGSVNVQTKKPKSLRANFAKGNNLSDVFTVIFGLTDANENASREASTLTSINFTLYQGATTEGKVEVFKKKIDVNDDEYISTLKQLFYDDTAVINADFFDSENVNFKQKTYTLVVDGAYDYTGFDTNIIPIENNIFQFDVNNYIPSLPDPDTPQVTVKQIQNSLANSFGLEYNSELASNTIVGLNTLATYDNNSENAKYIIYHVWIKNPANGEFQMISELDKQVSFNSDGTLSPIVLPVYQGTQSNVVDTDFIRRGNEYFISFEAYLDIDGDGTIETIYPNSIDNTVLLKSDNFKIKKQSSSFKLYPATSNANSMTWKYMYTDYDQILSDNKLYGYIDASTTASSSPSISIGEDYQNATFTGLSKGKTLTIKKCEKPYKNNSHSYIALTAQYFYGYQSSLNLSYSVESADNVVTLLINNYTDSTTQALIDSIATMNIVVEPVNSADKERLGVKTLENVNLKNGRVTISYFDIQEYYGVEIKLKLVAKYDTGEIGFDYTPRYLALQNGSYSEPGNYYTFSGHNLTQVSSVYRNGMNITFLPNSMLLTLVPSSNRMYDYTVDIDQTGVVYNNNNLIVKNVKESNLSSNDNQMMFDFIVPGISMHDASNKITIAPLLTGAYVTATISTFSETVIKDNLIYFELFETNSAGTGAVYVDTLSHNVSEFGSAILIDNLKNQANYYIRVYANVLNPKTNLYEKHYLYDVNQQAIGVNYNFHTLSDVGISNVRVAFVANSYTDKKVTIDYNLENVTGYNYIAYTLYKKNGNVYDKVNSINIPRSTSFFRSMHIELSAAPSITNELVYGGSYRINIAAYGEFNNGGSSSEIALGSSMVSFEIPESEDPYVGITSGKDSDLIYFRVTINDDSHVIEGDKYDIQLVDSNQHVIASQTDIDSTVINRRFSFNGDTYGLVNGNTYTFRVITKHDYTNTRQNIVTKYKTRSIQYGSSVDLGTVFLSKNADNPELFDLIFSDSYRLTSIERITYSVSSINTGFYISKTGNFDVRYDSDLDLYIYTIDLTNVELDPNNVYLFTFNFYKGNELVSETEIDYYNGGGTNEATP